MDRSAPWVVDALVGVAVALTVALIITAHQGGERAPDVIAYLVAAGFGALVLARRVLPRTVLVLTVLALFGYYIRDYPPIGMAVPVVAALFAAADAGLLRWAIGSGLVVFTVSTYFQSQDEERTLLGYESVSNAALIAAAIALGHSLRAHRLAVAQQAELTRLSAVQSRQEAERRLQSERERISRDLHDSVGHTLAVISLQANVAAEALGPQDRTAGEALARIRETSSQSLRELRSLVRALRSDTGPELLSLAAVDDLAAGARATGLRVSLEITAHPGDLSPSVDAAAYRVVQESLTNVVRHARASTAHVTAEVRNRTLYLTVVDNGCGATDPVPVGHGLAGMSERVRLLGGTLSTRSDGGFTVMASLPARLGA